MSLGKLLKTFFGGSDTPSISDDPFGRDKPLPTASIEQQPLDAPPLAPVVVHRDEIIGERSRITGYRFQARRVGSSVPPPPVQAVAALMADNVRLIAERRMALIPLAVLDWSAADWRPLIAPHTTFLLEVTPNDENGEAWLAVIDEIKSAGGRIALGSAVIDHQRTVIGRTDLVIIDYRAYAFETFERLAKKLKATYPHLLLAVDNIASWAEHRLCQSLGIRASLGGFAATPDDEDKKDKLNQSRLVLIEMLNMIRQNADLIDLVPVAKRDPAITVKLLNMANSPMAGLSFPVGSVDQALMVLGRDAVYRWLSLGLFRAGSDGRDETLLEIALLRARFLELVASPVCSKKECDELFLVGLLSLLDSLLGLPMKQALERIALPEKVVNVLLKNEGPFGRFLMLALAMERGRYELTTKIAEQLGLTEDSLDRCRAEAAAWVEDALQQS